MHICNMPGGINLLAVCPYLHPIQPSLHASTGIFAVNDTTTTPLVAGVAVGDT